MGAPSPEHWAEVERLVDQALDRAPGEWSELLDRACGGNAALRAEVDRLLRAAQSPHGCLGETAAAYAAPLVARIMNSQALAPGARLGAYEITRKLGRGGMAAVYLARDLKHDRQVAVKVLRPQIAIALGPERFLREIQIAATLAHPHIIPLQDSGETEGLIYYVMPYVDGESLRGRLEREGSLRLAAALNIAQQVLAALGYAHAHGIVHRDIKPENILLEGDQAMVADFGIARAVSEAGAERLTVSGLTVGTPAYMSPEQASGREDLDGRSDLYSLGCVLYEMLAGEPPFTGATAQAMIARQCAEQPRSLRVVRPDLPATVGTAVETALAKVPAGRYPSASEFARALAAVSSDAPYE